MDDLITRVQGSTLVVQRRDSSGTIDLGDDDVTVTVWTPQLDAARIDGSGDLGLGDVVVKSAAISLSGSGDADVGRRVLAHRRDRQQAGFGRAAMRDVAPDREQHRPGGGVDDAPAQLPNELRAVGLEPVGLGRELELTPRVKYSSMLRV